VFARALAASVCRALRIDPTPVLAKLPGAKRPGLADADRTISRSLRSAAPRSGAGSNWLPSRPLLIVVLLLLFGAAVLFWLPQSIFDQVGASIAQLTAREPADQGSNSSTASTGDPAGAVTGSAAPAAPALPPPAEAIPAEPVAAAPEAPVANDLIAFTARDDSWITVTEAGGKQLLRRTVKAGETVGVTGALPLQVVIGRASVVDVRVRGKAFDLAPLIRSGGVARFEIKS
jgi:cytoskeleton protein RodZ